MKRLFTLMMTLALALSCVFSVSAFAADPETADNRASLYFASYRAAINSQGDGNLVVNANAQTNKVVNELRIKKIVIQEKSGSTWKTVKTFTDTTNASFIAKNDAYIDVSVKYSGTKGKTYRAQATVYAGDASGSDTKTCTSSSITA